MLISTNVYCKSKKGVNMQNLFIKLIIFISLINLSLYARSENDTNAVLNLKPMPYLKWVNTMKQKLCGKI